MKIEDDSGTPHNFTIPYSYYIHEYKHRLFIHHWDRDMKKQGKGRSNSKTEYDKLVLCWGNSFKTVPLDIIINIVTFYTAPDYSSLSELCAEVGLTRKTRTKTLSMPSSSDLRRRRWLWKLSGLWQHWLDGNGPGTRGSRRSAPATPWNRSTASNYINQKYLSQVEVRWSKQKTRWSVRWLEMNPKYFDTTKSTLTLLSSSYISWLREV